MRRRLFTVASVVSLLLCMATVAMWVRSYFAWDLIGLKNERILEHSSEVAAWSGNGAFWLFHEGYDARLRSRWPPVFGWSIEVNVDPVDLRNLALDLNPQQRLRWVASEHNGTWQNGQMIVACPYWLAAALTSLLPAVLVIRRTRSARWRTHRRCFTCGYDLTGNISGICPECGTKIVSH